MSKNSFKNKLFKINAKNTFLTINVPKTSLNLKYKNLKLSNGKNIPININYRTISTSSMNSTKNKNKLIIPKLIRNSNLEKSQNNKLEKLKSFGYIKSKDLDNKIINSNYFDINNNNYFVNLFHSSTPKYKKIDINKKFSSKESRNLINKVKYLNLTNIKNKFNQSMTTLSSNVKKYSFNTFNNTYNNEAFKKMKNYRNKLLLEFMKHFQRFILLYKKRYFSFLIEQIKSIKRKEFSYKFIYKKKIQQISRNNDLNKYYTYNNSSKRILKNEHILNRKANINFNNIDNSLIKRKIIVNKIINNKSKDVINDEIRNVFISPNYKDKIIFQKNNINHSIKSTKEDMNLLKLNSDYKNKKDVTEIEVNFKRSINNILTEKNKINIRFNEIIYKRNKSKKKNLYIKYKNNFSKCLVNSFCLNCNNNINNDFLELRKKYINSKKENKILSSIIEVDEIISGSLQDSFKIDNK